VGCGALLTSGCAFQGLNSLPLPGAVGRGPGANVYHVELDNVGTLESNSPVLMNDVVIGSVGAMKLKGWHADVEISVKPDVGIPPTRWRPSGRQACSARCTSRSERHWARPPAAGWFPARPSH
jgi:hypothetical protein